MNLISEADKRKNWMRYLRAQLEHYPEKVAIALLMAEDYLSAYRRAMPVPDATIFQDNTGAVCRMVWDAPLARLVVEFQRTEMSWTFILRDGRTNETGLDLETAMERLAAIYLV